MKIFLRFLLFAAAGIVLLFVAAIIVFALFVRHNNTEKSAKTDILKAQSANAPKALVVYQPSWVTNTTKDISYEIAKGLNSEGYEVTITYPGKKLSTDISSYKVIAFGSPIYIGQTSSVLNNYIKDIKVSDSQKTLLFVTGDNDDTLPLDSLEKLLPNTKATIKTAFQRKDEKNKTKAFNLGQEITKN